MAKFRTMKMRGLINEKITNEGGVEKPAGPCAPAPLILAAPHVVWDWGGLPRLSLPGLILVTRYKIRKAVLQIQKKHTWRHQDPSEWCFLPGIGAMTGPALVGSTPLLETFRKTLRGLWMGYGRRERLCPGEHEPQRPGPGGWAGLRGRGEPSVAHRPPAGS